MIQLESPIKLNRVKSLAGSARVVSESFSTGEGIMLMTLCLLVALVPLAFAAPLFEPYIGAKEILIQAGTGTAGLLWLLTVRTNSLTLTLTPVWIPLILLLTIGSASLMWSSHPSASFLESQRLATYVLLFVVTLQTMSRPESRTTLATILVLAGSIEAVYVLLQYSFGDPIFLTDQLSGKWQTFGTLGNPNWTGEFLAVTGLISLGRLANLHRQDQPNSSVRPFERYLTLGAFISILLALTATLARAAWVGFIIGALAFLMARRHGKWRSGLKSFLLRLSVTAIAVVVLIVLPLLTNQAAINHLLNIKSVRGRLLMWEVTVAMIRDMPWSGFGLGTFGLNFPNYQAEALSQTWAIPFIDNASFPSYAHNDYLQLWSELGIFGLLAFVALMWIGFKRSRALAGEPVALGCWAAVVSLLVNATVAFPLHLPASLMLFVVLVAVVEATAAKKAVRLSKFPLVARIGIGLLILTVCFFAYRLSYDRLVTEAALWKADAALRNGGFNEAEVAIRTAIDRTPTRLDGHVLLARLHVERREYNKALLVLDNARGLGFNEEIYNLKSTALEALEQRTAAINTLNELIRLRPDLQWARQRLSALSTEADHQEIKQ